MAAGPARRNSFAGKDLRQFGKNLKKGLDKNPVKP
tara:strand:- start:83 stop:187 length:105 start_codon:yes stop_codon:yes gene_type:complete